MVEKFGVLGYVGDAGDEYQARARYGADLIQATRDGISNFSRSVITERLQVDVKQDSK